ncbi:MAG: hypothetical protein ACRET6_01260 [Burkholderiales bacterium]
MNVYQYDGRRQRALKPAASRLGEELLRANGYPTSRVIDLARYRMPQEPGPQLPSDCGGVDMRAFIERVRALATQI